MAISMKAMAVAALSLTASAVNRRTPSVEGQDLMDELADTVLGFKEGLLPIPFEMILERDVGYVGEHPIMDNSTCVTKQESLGTVREVDGGHSPNIPIGTVYIKDSDQPPIPAANFRTGGTTGGLDLMHLNGVINPTAELTVWQWQRNKYFGAKAWLDGWLTRYPDKLVILHSAGDVLYGGCDENSIQFKYDQIVAAAGGTQKIVLGAEVAPYPSDLGWKYATSTDAATQRDTVLSAFGLSSGWTAPYAACTGETNTICDSPTPLYQYASSSFIMGPVSDVSDMLSSLAQYTGLENRFVNEYFLENPDLVTLDYAAKLSFSLHGLGMPVQVQTDGSGNKEILNKVTNEKVCFVHGTGNAYSALKGLAAQVKAL